MLGPFKVFGNMFMGFLCLGGSLYGKPYVLALDEDSGGAPGCGWSFPILPLASSKVYRRSRVRVELPRGELVGEWYRGRLIKASPYDRRDWYVYCVEALGIPVLYVGISTDPDRRFEAHIERFKWAPQPLGLWVYDEVFSHVEARRMEIDLHIEYPHARTIQSVWEYVHGVPLSGR
jgi:predicted GIY-YIG superfamily endonuclease